MKPLARILYGSQNYNLSGPESDKDYRTITFPTISELYSCKLHSTNEEWDVRKFVDLILKGNFNALELLFSVEKEFYDKNFEELWYFYRGCASTICEYKSKSFFASCRGCALQSISRAESAENEAQFAKQMARAQYLLDFLDTVRLSHFNLTDNTWRGFFTETARKIRFENAPVDKFEIMTGFSQLEPYFVNTEDLPLYCEDFAFDYFKKGLIALVQ